MYEIKGECVYIIYLVETIAMHLSKFCFQSNYNFLYPSKPTMPACLGKRNRGYCAKKDVQERIFFSIFCSPTQRTKSWRIQEPERLQFPWIFRTGPLLCFPSARNAKTEIKKDKGKESTEKCIRQKNKRTLQVANPRAWEKNDFCNVIHQCYMHQPRDQIIANQSKTRKVPTMWKWKNKYRYRT